MNYKNDRKGTLIAFSCFVIMFIHLGTLGTAGLFIPQFVKTLNVPVSQVSLNVTFSSLTGFVFSLLVGKLGTYISAKKMILIGSVVGMLHFLVTASTNNILIVYIGSILGGIKFGLGTHTCIAAVISSWFSEKRSTVIGIVFSGAAFGSAVMMYISGILIESIGWRSTYLVFAAMHMFIAIPINLFILHGVKKSGNDYRVVNSLKSENSPENESCESSLTIRDIHRCSSYWMLLISMALCGTLIIGFKTFVPSFWQSNGMLPITSSKYISVFMVIATIATSVSGRIADKFSNMVYIIYLHTSFVIGMICVLIFANTLEAIYITIPLILVAIAYPLYGSIPATVAAEVFGLDNYDKVCGELMAAFFIGQAMVSPIIGGLRDITGTYSTGFTIITILGMISCILIVWSINVSPAKKALKEDCNENMKSSQKNIVFRT